MKRTPTTLAVVAFLAAVIATFPAIASAEDSGNAAGFLSASSSNADIQLPPALRGDTEIEQLTNAYKNAQNEVEAAETKVAELQERIDEIEAALPAQEARSNAGIKQRYIMQSNPIAIAEPLLSSQTLDDFLQQIDYLEIASRSNLREFNKMVDMKAQLDDARAEQVSVRENAAARAEEACRALNAEQDARAKTQHDGQENAITQAEQLGGKESAGKAADGGKQPKDYREEAAKDTAALSDGVDWHVDRDAFIDEWGKRIDAYLAGSPLAGQGANFAASSWKWGVDPRWSPAISNTESSKGAFCIRPHNAWGWGAADSDPYGLALEWKSWEEAIDAHVKGLAEGYGYTISMSAAMKYCPNTWQSWYNKTLAQMALI